MSKLTAYSVLMSVYYKEKAEYLCQAIDSMLNQTIPPDDFVLVCDGPLTKELDGEIVRYKREYPNLFQIIRLKTNQGLGNALNIGLGYCKNELVARMDSDDISIKSRCDVQLQMFARASDLAICGGSIAEFDGSISNVTGIRKVPKDNKDIVLYAKKRNPFNHVTVMFRKSEVERAGNYVEISLAEDYYLWVRMIQKNMKMGNTDKVLVLVRTGKQMLRRRGGIEYIKKICTLQKLFYERKFISKKEYLINCVIRVVAGCIPLYMRRFLYYKVLRENIKI